MSVACNLHQTRGAQAPRIPLPKQFLMGDASALASFPVTRRAAGTAVSRKPKTFGAPASTSNVKALFDIAENLLTGSRVKGVVTTVIPLTDPLKNLGFSIVPDVITDLTGLALELELVAAELDPKTGKEKESVKGNAYFRSRDGNEVTYETYFQVPRDFGQIGAVLVKNRHTKEMFIKTIILSGIPDGPISISCESWVHSVLTDSRKRVFFTNKSYLPSKTPSGLKNLRENELVILRGDGTRERERHERIYDYDVYNDLGNPDFLDELARPVLGGKEHPYPRRCRTGRPPTKKDPNSESRDLIPIPYVPRDEDFSEVKTIQFGLTTLYSALHAVVPTLEEALVDGDRRFPYFTEIDKLFNEGIHVPALKKNLRNLIPRIIKSAKDTEDEVLLFETPELIDRDKFSWFRDEEFSRQTLAGLNPCCIQLVKEWPLKSNLDPQVYGSQESAITKDIVEEAIRGCVTLEEALKEKRLFVLDYHDLVLPYVNKVRQLEGTTLYGSRTLFFVTSAGTLRPIAIELTRPPGNGKPIWKQVFTPTWDATGAWLWKLAKAHVLAHDSAIHQLISHWLRTHCAVEPYIIAANRQLSAMHPIYRLLKPHFRYTMNINALARGALINAGGIIETTFAPGKYAMEVSSVIYDKQWRFDHEALPADLISRGMAVEDPTAPHGLKLTIEDYPFANDGLLLWDVIKQWVTDYVKHYYPEAGLVESDKELQAWWTEVRTVGHADKKDEPWWPLLKTPDDLIGILTTIIWVTAGHHAAVNFGQYDFGGYFPNRPTTARIKIPSEDPTEDEWEQFEKRPEDILMETLPSQIQATKVMTVLDVLSTHSPDEEYIGKELEPSWEEDANIKAAFDRFNGRLKEIEGIIEERNSNKNLKNRTGAGVVPYTLLKPYSEKGVTGMGVPNSISI